MATKTETKLTENERAVLSAVFARTTMGCEQPSTEKVQYATMRPPSGGDPIANDWVPFFCSEFMTNESDEAAFNSEANSWWREFGKRGQNTREYVCKTWPEIGTLFGWSI